MTEGAVRDHESGPWRHSPAVADVCARLLANHPLGRLLDAGGGEGFVTAHLMRSRVVDEATVIDRDAGLLTRVPPPIRTRCRRLEDLDDSDGEFTTILIRQVLHYLDEPERTLERIAARLRPGGAIYIGQIVAPGPDAARYLADFAGWTSSSRRRVWTLGALLAIVSPAGLHMERAVVEPYWQPLTPTARVSLPGVAADPPGLLMRCAGGAMQARVLFLHALLRGRAYR